MVDDSHVFIELCTLEHLSHTTDSWLAAMELRRKLQLGGGLRMSSSRSKPLHGS